MHKLEWLSKEDLIKRLVQSEFGRFLNYYANAPEIEQPAERPERHDAKSAEREARRDRNAKGEHVAEEGYKRLFLNFGKRDNFFAREIINLVNRYVKGKVEIGRIDLLTNCAFFEVPEDDAQFVINKMAKAKVGERRVVVDWADRAEGNAASTPHERRPRRNNNDRSYGRKGYDTDKNAFAGGGKKVKKQSEPPTHRRKPLAERSMTRATGANFSNKR